MDDIPLGALVGALIALILLSTFFSASKTAMLSLNRHRLRHLVKGGHRGATIAAALLRRPVRLIGLILLCNTFVNVGAAALATLIGLRLSGEAGVAVAVGLLSFVILIFGEVAPKTLAAIKSERIAFPVALLLAPLLKILHPAVWLTHRAATSLLKIVGVSSDESVLQQLSREELRTIVNEAGALIPRRHQRMLLRVLDLENITVDDVMTPRNEIVGIDLDSDMNVILRVLTTSQHTRLPIYRESIDKVEGVIHIRNAIHLIGQNKLDPSSLVELARDAYFVPEGTPLNVQLLNFRRQKHRIAFVVDEYGDIRGLVTLEDLLEEIVGEFTTDNATAVREIQPQNDGSFLVDGSANIRELNRLMQWELPTDGPKTINGLIIEHMEFIPEPGISLMIEGYPIEVVQTSENAVKTARIYPLLRRAVQDERS